MRRRSLAACAVLVVLCLAAPLVAAEPPSMRCEAFGRNFTCTAVGTVEVPLWVFVERGKVVYSAFGPDITYEAPKRVWGVLYMQLPIRGTQAQCYVRRIKGRAKFTTDPAPERNR